MQLKDPERKTLALKLAAAWLQLAEHAGRRAPAPPEDSGQDAMDGREKRCGTASTDILAGPTHQPQAKRANVPRRLAAANNKPPFRPISNMHWAYVRMLFRDFFSRCRFARLAAGENRRQKAR
jgi:hypothetical protein